MCYLSKKDQLTESSHWLKSFYFSNIESHYTNHMIIFIESASHTEVNEVNSTKLSLSFEGRITVVHWGQSVPAGSCIKWELPLPAGKGQTVHSCSSVIGTKTPTCIYWLKITECTDREQTHIYILCLETQSWPWVHLTDLMVHFAVA